MKVISTEGNPNIMSKSWPSKGKCFLFYFHFLLHKPGYNFNSELLNKENDIYNCIPCALITYSSPHSTEKSTYKTKSIKTRLYLSLLSTKKQIEMIYFVFNT